jgi:hypothetical protein
MSISIKLIKMKGLGTRREIRVQQTRVFQFSNIAAQIGSQIHQNPS